MPTLETLTQDDLRGALKAKSMRRARGYVNAIENPVRAGKTLTAQINGSRVYYVEIDVEPDGIHAQCSCPYNWGGYCKHVGAVLLKWIQSPGDFAIENTPLPPSKEYPIEVIPVAPPPTNQPEQLPHWLTFSFADRHQADEQELWKGLQEIKLQDLRQMAKKRGWKIKGNRKADIAQQIATHITAPRDVLQAIRQLDAEHQNVLRAMVLMGEKDDIPEDELERAASAWGDLKSYRKVGTYASHLWKAGLALPGNEGDYPPQSDFVPRAILRSLPPILGTVIPAAAHPQPSVSDIRLADPYPFIQAAIQIVLLLEQSATPLRPPMPRPRLEKFHSELEKWDYVPEELALAKKQGLLQRYSSDLALIVPPPTRSLPNEAIERLAPVAGDEGQIEFIFSLLTAAGIFQPGNPVTVWTETKDQFLRLNKLTQRAILARTFFQMENWSALWEVLRTNHRLQLRRMLRRYHKPENLRADLTRFRRLALHALSSLPDGKWIALQDLFHPLRAIWPQFNQTVWSKYRDHNGIGSWYMASASDGQPLSPTDAKDWNSAQGHFVQQIIAGPLHGLGLADLGFENGELAAVRFHGLADLFWDRVDVPDAPPHATQQAHTISPEKAIKTDAHAINVAPSAIPAEAHNLLNKIARLETATAERFTYQLDSQVVYETFEAGAALSELLDNWEHLLPIPMPDAIRDQLTSWWTNYGQVRIYENLTVIEFGDDYALTEMRAVTPLDEFLVAEISPRLVIVREESVAPLTEMLEKAGYTPKHTDEV
ncbi:MAG: hypothetical protein GY832_45225 [Chloroflexi bacterium]|nr:hypothetical protein [Chloroflexota bacterium]